MSQKELENIYKRLENTIIKLGRQNGKNQFAKDLIYLFEQAELSQDLQEQNKRYREEIEQVYKDNYTKNTTEYKEGFLDGLDIALGIIDRTLEESEWT